MNEELTTQELENLEKAEVERRVGLFQARELQKMEEEQTKRLDQKGTIPLLFTLRPDNGSCFSGHKRNILLGKLRQDYKQELLRAGLSEEEAIDLIISANGSFSAQ